MSKGAKVAVAAHAFEGETSHKISILFRLQSPTEWGDLYSYERNTDSLTHRTSRRTFTMPRALAAKVRAPTEAVLDDGCHALIYLPAKPGVVRAVCWGHGGPMANHAYEFAPSFNWLADQGYVVVVPHFPGSTGFGLEFMDAVRGDGCGQADFGAFCNAGRQVLEGKIELPEGYTLDTSRGVAAAGHSWGGYLSRLAATRGDSPFSCVVASAGIADWAVQQRRTEVRYYDRWLMQGWCYEPDVAARAARANPDPKQLRVPLLLIHGTKDTDCPFSQVATFAERVPPPAAGEPLLQTLFLEGEGHGRSAWSKEHRKAWFDTTAAFLRCNLLPWNCLDNPHGDVTAY